MKWIDAEDIETWSTSEQRSWEIRKKNIICLFYPDVPLRGCSGELLKY